MALKLVPEIRARAYPQGAMERLSNTPVVIADEFSQMMNRDSADGAEIRATEQQQPSTWVEKNGLTVPDGLRIIMFYAGQAREGSTAAATAPEGALVGFAFREGLFPLNCRMHLASTGQARQAEGDAQYETVGFEPVFDVKDGAGRSRWDTVVPDTSPKVSRIFHAQQVPNKLLAVRSINVFDEDMCFIVHLTNLQKIAGHTSQARVRYVWADGAYAIVLREDAYPTLERRRRSKSGAISTAGNNWEVWRELTEVPKTKFTEDIDIQVEQVGARMYLQFNGKSADLIDTREIYGAAEKGHALTEEPVAITWPSGKHTLYLWGVSLTLGLTRILYADTGQSDAPPRSAQLRRLRAQHGLDAPPDTKGRVKAQGVRPPGTKVKPTATANGDDIRWTIEMKSDPDARYTPFITGISGYVSAEYSSDDLQALDITPAVNTWEVNLAEPGIATSAELQLGIERDVLDLLALPGDAPPGVNWQHYLDTGQYNPIDFAVRWHLGDGTTTDWVGLFKGYAWTVDKDAPEYGVQDMRVTGRDKTVRFKEPAALIKDNAAPLGYLITGRNAIYAADCIKEVVRIFLGDSEANLLNGNGNARRFLPPGHLPLFSMQNDLVGFYDLSGKPPISGGLLFKPPYLQHGDNWIGDFAREDAGGEDLAVFFAGFADTASQTGGETWPVFIYGMLGQVLANRNRWVIGDTIYAEITTDTILKSATAQSRPEVDFNETLVVISPTKFKKETFPGPGLFVGEAGLDADDPRSAKNTWARTQYKDLNLDYLGVNDAQDIAELVQMYTVGAEPITANLVLENGEPLMHWGDLVQPHMVRDLATSGNGDDSDATLGLSGQWFRAMRVRHYGNQIDRTFETQITAYTLSDFEVELLGLED